MAKVTQVRAWETTERTAKREEVRASVVGSVVAGLQAAGLSHAEYLCVVGAIHALLAETAKEQGSLLVTATAAIQGADLVSTSQVHSRTVMCACVDPAAVAETVELMVREASPELWAMIHEVLEPERA